MHRPAFMGTGGAGARVFFNVTFMVAQPLTYTLSGTLPSSGLPPEAGLTRTIDLSGPGVSELLEGPGAFTRTGTLGLGTYTLRVDGVDADSSAFGNHGGLPTFDVDLSVVPCVVRALVGSGQHIALPSPNPAAPPYQQAPLLGAIIPNVSFNGTWSTPAPACWIGTFTATGPVPSSENMGTTTYNFASLPQGGLPSGTFVLFGDVDGGSGSNEQITLRAFDVLNNPIITPWLDVAVTAWGVGGAGGSPTVSDIPGWNYNPTTGVYVIDGSTVTLGNPTVSFASPPTCVSRVLKSTRR